MIRAMPPRTRATVRHEMDVARRALDPVEAGKCGRYLRLYYELNIEPEWDSDGSYESDVTFPAGFRWAAEILWDYVARRCEPPA